jgi:hypothetical protein
MSLTLNLCVLHIRPSYTASPTPSPTSEPTPLPTPYALSIERQSEKTNMDVSPIPQVPSTRAA